MNSEKSRSPVLSSPMSAWKYTYWLICGALLGLAIASLLTVGIFIFPIGAALAAFGLWTTRLRNRSAAAVLAGLALAPFYLAWLNRSGPGEVCSSSGSEISCVDAWNPWPFIAIGVLLIAASLLLGFSLRPTRLKSPQD